jgi:hypothetical protein
LETSSLDMILLLTFKIHWSKDDIIHIVIITSMMSIILYRWANPLDLTRDSSPGQICYSASLKKLCHSKVWRKIIQSLPVVAENAIFVTYHTNQMGIRRANTSNERGEQPSVKTPNHPRPQFCVRNRQSIRLLSPRIHSARYIPTKSQSRCANLRVRKTPTESILRALFNLISW